MSLNTTVELSLMQPSEAMQAAQIIKRTWDLWLNDSDRQYDPHEAKAIAAMIQKAHVVVGKTAGDIVAAYQLPKPFAREAGLITIGHGAEENWREIGGFSYNGDHGYFAVGESGKRIGSAFFGRFGSVLEQLAHQFGASSLAHRDTIPFEGQSFAEKMGYRVVLEKTGNMNDFLVVERKYEPREHALSVNERNVLDALAPSKVSAMVSSRA